MVYLIGFDWKQSKILNSSARLLLFGLILFLALRIRSKISRLSDDDLSDFLSMSVIKGSLFVGLSQLLFLAFSSIQCVYEAKLEGKDWKACKRSLYSQTGLGGLVALYTIITLMSGVVPRKYIEQHIVKSKKIIRMDLNLKEVSAF